jgi:putative endonuclease
MSYYVYVLASARHGTLYIGVTNDLIRRIYEHKVKAVPSFASRYGVDKLVWFEIYDSAEATIRREKEIKKWKRDWKIRLIEETNPDWIDLFDGIASLAKLAIASQSPCGVACAGARFSQLHSIRATSMGIFEWKGLAPTITPAIASHQIGDRILYSGANRHDDRYIEVHVYEEISPQSLSKATPDPAPTTSAFFRTRLGSTGGRSVRSRGADREYVPPPSTSCRHQCAVRRLCRVQGRFRRLSGQFRGDPPCRRADAGEAA